MTKRPWATEDVDQPWSIGEAIGVAMGAFRRRFGAAVLPSLIAAIVVQIAALAPAAVRALRTGLALVTSILRSGGALSSVISPAESMGYVWAAVAISVLGGALIFALLTESSLTAVRDEKLAPALVRRSLITAVRLFAFQMLSLAATMLPGAIVLGAQWLYERAFHGGEVWWYVVAGLFVSCAAITWSLLFAFTPFFLVDDRVGLFRAMQLSLRATNPYLGTLFLYLVALTPITLLSFIPVIGIIPAAFVRLGLAYGYLRATGRNDIPWYGPEFGSRSIRQFLGITLVGALVVFGGLVACVRGLPAMRGNGFSVQDTAVRVSAILSGVGGVVVLLALLLPYGLDRLEGRRFVSFVAARHVRSQKSGFLTVISILSICGVAISSCALSSVVSVMGGFSQDLKRKILGNNAHIVIDTVPGTPFADYDGMLERVRKVPGVVGATPVVNGEVMASSSSNLAGVLVAGIDPQSIDQVIELSHNIEVGKIDYLEHPEKLTRLSPTEVIGIGPGGEQYFRGSDLPSLDGDIDPTVRAVLLTKPDRSGIVLGRELAKTLHVYVGDEVTLVSPLGDLGPMGIMPRTRKFRVAAIFYSGMYEYDAMHVYTTLSDAQDYFATSDKVSAIDVKVEDAERADRQTDAVTAAVGNDSLRVRDWREINRNLFSALKLERIATFMILLVAILVASFCIVCTLLLMVTEKGKEIAILKAIGASDGSILRIFMIEGIIIGGIGTAFGVVTGLALCTGLSWFGLRLDPEVYYIDRLPISVNGWDFLTVALAALTICTLSTVYPAFAASRLRPVDGLRYE